MTDDQIKDRIDGRRIADEILALAELAGKGESKEWAVAFWCQVGMKLHEAEKLLKIATMPPRPKLIPMSDGEARLFAEKPMPFGKHKDTRLWAVLRDDPQYLDWLVRATEEDDFKENLRRWLAHEDNQAEIPDNDWRGL